MRRSVTVVLIFVAASAVSFVWLAGALERALAGGDVVAWLRQQRGDAWWVGGGLLVSDLLLPVPTSAVLTALGVVYGAFWGGVVGAAGSFAAAATGYWLCRAVGERGARWLLGADDLGRAQAFFAGRGALLVAGSRWVPVLPELLACAAGLAGMRWSRFALASLCGCVPLGFAWAGVGAWGRDAPGWALALSIVVPLALWYAVSRRVR